MAMKWDQILSTLDGCEATVRLKSATSSKWTLQGKISLDEKDYLLFVMETEPATPLPERAFSEITIKAARGVLRGECVMVRRSPRHMQVIVSGDVEIVQRRGSFRFGLDTPVILINPSQREELASLLDLSISGGRVEVASPQPKGETVHIRIERTPVGDLVLAGLVRSSVKASRGKWYIGLEWNLTTPVWEQVKKLLLTVMENRWPTGGFVPTPKASSETADSSLLKRAENARELITRILDLLEEDPSGGTSGQEVVRLSVAVIHEVASIGKILKQNAG